MMTTSCKELRTRAWNRLKNGKYGVSLGASLLYSVIGPAGTVFTAGPMEYGVRDFFISQQRDENPAIDKVFGGFNRFGDSLVTCILQTIYLALWSLLFAIPGLIKSFSYGVTYYVMKDFGLTGNAAITKSRELMNGYKWKLFCLNLSFIGWILLGMLTGGIGLFFLMPYMQAAEAEFYAELLTCNGVTVAP